MDTLRPDICSHFLLQYRGFPLSEIKNVLVTLLGPNFLSYYRGFFYCVLCLAGLLREVPLYMSHLNACSMPVHVYPLWSTYLHDTCFKILLINFCKQKMSSLEQGIRHIHNACTYTCVVSLLTLASCKSSTKQMRWCPPLGM